MEALATFFLIIAYAAGAYVFCMFLRWFLGIRNLEQKLDQALAELEMLRQANPPIGSTTRAKPSSENSDSSKTGD